MFKKPIFIIPAVIILGLVIWGIFSLGGEEEARYDYVLVEKSDLVQEVSVTGKVEPAQRVDLAFEKSGRVTVIPVKVGSKVSPGTLLVGLDQSELSAQRAEADAALGVQQAKLDEMKKGTRLEEIQIAEINVANARESLEDDEINLEDVKVKRAMVAETESIGSLVASNSKGGVIGDMVGNIELSFFEKDLKIKSSPNKSQAHYDYTPYSFSPKIGYKLTDHLYLDMGQGLLECLQEIQREVHNELDEPLLLEKQNQ